MTTPNTSKPRANEHAPAARPRPLVQSLLTHLAVAGTAALAASSAQAQVTTFTNINENVGFTPSEASFFTLTLPGTAQFAFAAQVSSGPYAFHFIAAGQNNGYVRLKTQTVNSLYAPVFSPAGQKFSMVPGSVNGVGDFVANTSSNAFHLGYNAGDKGYVAFEFKDTTNNNQLDYGWVNLSVTNQNYNSMNVNIASYAYDLSGRELPTGATSNPAPAPEPSPALALAVLSALTLGAAGVRRMKDLRA